MMYPGLSLSMYQQCTQDVLEDVPAMYQDVLEGVLDDVPRVY